MAIERLSYKGAFERPQQDFQIETLAEIADLPTQTKEMDNNTAPTGSMAICEEDWSIWRLKINGTWEKIYGKEDDSNAGEE